MPGDTDENDLMMPDDTDENDPPMPEDTDENDPPMPGDAVSPNPQMPDDAVSPDPQMKKKENGNKLDSPSFNLRFVETCEVKPTVIVPPTLRSLFPCQCGAKECEIFFNSRQPRPQLILNTIR